MTKSLSEQLCEICEYKPVVYDQRDDILRCYYCEHYVWHRLADGDERLSCGKDGKRYSCNKMDNISKCHKVVYVLPDFEHDYYNFVTLLNVIHKLKFNHKIRTQIDKINSGYKNIIHFTSYQAFYLDRLIWLLGSDIKLRKAIVDEIRKVDWKWGV